ncbi:hypothetical protein LCGC14_2726520 [marine sediment metagenome]|uniref:AAA domain-containing protein n=1 Tax=marine sediment metagenome TaxID=412755 RepID=A0A0F8ZVZ1_9ZZZZ
MKRDITWHLEEWKKSHRRKPLILNGARQVGKTYSLKHFGKSFYEKMAYFNFEKDVILSQYELGYKWSREGQHSSQYGLCPG